MGFGSSISAGERPQTFALDRAATGTGKFSLLDQQNRILRSQLSMVIKTRSVILCYDIVYSCMQQHGGGTYYLAL